MKANVVLKVFDVFGSLYKDVKSCVRVNQRILIVLFVRKEKDKVKLSRHCYLFYLLVTVKSL